MPITIDQKKLQAHVAQMRANQAAALAKNTAVKQPASTGTAVQTASTISPDALGFASEIGRAQKAFQEYKAANRPDLQKGASAFADKLRAQAKAAGVDLSGLGVQNKYGTDFTQYFSGDKAGVYDPSKSGQVLAQRDTTILPEGQAIDSSSVNGPSTNSTAQSFIDQLAEARRSKVLADLGKSRDAALSNLSAERSTIQPRFYDARNQVAAGSQRSARNFAEFMAARGGTSAGSNAQAELSRNAALQGSLGELGRQETQANTDIDRRTTDVQNAFQSDVASANAGMEADRMNALLNDYYVAQQRNDRLAQLAIENELAKAGLTGILNGERTLPGMQFDRGVLESDRNFAFQKGQQEWQNNFNQGQFDWQKAQQAWENAFQENNFEQQMQEAAASRGLQWASLSQRDKEFLADQKFKEKSLKLETQRENRLSSESSSTPLTSSSYKTNPRFAETYQEVLRDPEGSRVLLNNSAARFISEFSFEGYQALLKALPKTEEKSILGGN